MNVFIFATDSLMGVARFPQALQEAGFVVTTLCPKDSFISKTRFNNRLFLLREVNQGPKFIQATIADIVQGMIATTAQFVIPADERAVYVLHYIVRESLQGRLHGIPKPVLEVIQTSLGDPAYFEATNNKNFTQQLAAELGIGVPQQLVVTPESNPLEFAAKIGYPVVLKKGIGFAAQGVKVCQNEQELAQSLKLPLFAQPSPFKQQIQRLLGRNSAWIPNSDALAIQQFVSGTPAVFTLVALKGRILAGFTGMKVGASTTGQTTRLRCMEHAVIAAAATAFMNRVQYTGFADLEFMVDATSGVPFLLECNPRPTPVAPFGKQIGIDLCAALLAGLKKTPWTSPAQLTGEEEIVLFPQEWFRDPQSPYLKSNTLDIPWDDPELMRAYMLTTA